MSEEVKNQEPQVEESQPEVVPYESHRKLLDEKKKERENNKALQAELEKYRKAEESRQQVELEEKGEYSKILDQYKSKIGELEGALENHQASKVSDKKKQAFLSALPGSLKNEKYLSFADLNDVAVNPDTGEVDPLGLKSAIDSFVSEHGSLLNAPKSSTVTDRAAPVAHSTSTNLQGKSASELRDMLLSGKFK